MFKIHHKHYFDEDILCLLQTIICKENKIMTAFDDLTQAISDITISINAEIQALSDAKASSNDAAIEQAVSNLKTLNTQLQASVTPPAATPAA